MKKCANCGDPARFVLKKRTPEGTKEEPLCDRCAAAASATGAIVERVGPKEGSPPGRIVFGALIVLLASLAAGCAPMQDALVPDEMTWGYARGKIESDDRYASDAETYQFGVSFTWDLRKDERRELRAILEEIRNQNTKGK